MSPGAVVAIVTTLETVGAMASSAHAPLAPFLKRDLALTDTQVGLLTTAVYFGGFISGLPAGALGDRLGVRLMFVLTQVPFGLLVLLAPHMPSYAWLFAVLLGAGLGYGCLSPQTAKAVVTWAPAGRRATMMGIKQMGITLGSALGASILPALALWAGWRAGYRLAGAAVVTAALVAYAVYR
ncbi:MAG: MFS transporter, partial [Clostridia bacterium]|nr:MFS transporter [Clostridia bacterium]